MSGGKFFPSDIIKVKFKAKNWKNNIVVVHSTTNSTIAFDITEIWYGWYIKFSKT